MPRCFIAIDLPDEIKNELVLVQKELTCEDLFVGKYVEQENLHLTLAFLGELDDTTLAGVQAALGGIFFKPFDLKLAEIGVFRSHAPHVLWVALRGAPVFCLQKQVESTVRPLVVLDNKPFASHVTLARIKQIHDRKKFDDLVQHAHVQPLKFVVHEFVLKESQLTSDGPVYQIVQRYSAHDE